MHDQGTSKIKLNASFSTHSFFPKIRISKTTTIYPEPAPICIPKFPGLSRDNGLFHGIFTRLGGVSDDPFYSLNLSYAVGDRHEDVNANLLKIKNIAQARSLAFLNQNHGDSIVTIEEKDFFNTGHDIPTADAMITNVPDVALIIKQADCQAVIILDPIERVVANVHCGWRGNVKNILGRVVRKMEEGFGCRGTNLQAAIGPSLGPCCGEFKGYEKIFPASFKHYMVKGNIFDLWAVSCRQLTEAGIRQENIELTGLCTCCNTDLFFSYRAEGKTGRFGTVAMLRELN